MRTRSMFGMMSNRLGNRGDDIGVRVTADHRPPGTNIVDVTLAIDIDQVCALGSIDERGRAADAVECAYRGIDAAGNDSDSLLKKSIGISHSNRVIVNRVVVNRVVVNRVSCWSSNYTNKLLQMLADFEAPRRDNYQNQYRYSKHCGEQEESGVAQHIDHRPRIAAEQLWQQRHQ